MTYAVDNFYQWLKVAKAGDVCIYHTGLLMADRMKRQWSDNGTLQGHKLDRTLEDLRKAVLTAAAHKDVLLTQRKISDGLYEYLATRTRRNRAI